MGDSEYGESGYLSIFTLLKALMMLLKYKFFSGLHFYILPKTLIACRAIQLIFFKVETVLNNAFKPHHPKQVSNIVMVSTNPLERNEVNTYNCAGGVISFPSNRVIQFWRQK